MHLTADRLSIMLGGGMFAVATVGLVASALGVVAPLALEGLAAIAGLAAGAKVS